MRKLTAVASLSLISLMAVAQNPPLIRVPVRIVEVPVAVTTRNGTPVKDLTAGDFLVFDNGQARKVRLEFTEQPVSVVVAVQTNDAVRNWLPEVRRMKDAVEALIAGAGGQAAVIGFNDTVTLLQPLTNDTQLLDRAFNSLTASGEKSKTLDAVMMALRQLSPLPGARRRVILLISQAGDSGSTSRLDDALMKMEPGNTILYSLVMPRIGKDLPRDTLSASDMKGVNHADAAHPNDTGVMASVDLTKLVPEILRGGRSVIRQDAVSILTGASGGRHIAFRSLHDLENGMATIGTELHTEYVLSYTQSGDQPGYHTLRVEVARPKVRVRARPGYFSVARENER